MCGSAFSAGGCRAASHGTTRQAGWNCERSPRRLSRCPPFVPNCASMATAPLVSGILPDGECSRSRDTARRSDLAGWAEYEHCASHSRYF